MGPPGLVIFPMEEETRNRDTQRAEGHSPGTPGTHGSHQKQEATTRVVPWTRQGEQGPVGTLSSGLGPARPWHPVEATQAVERSLVAARSVLPRRPAGSPSPAWLATADPAPDTVRPRALAHAFSSPGDPCLSLCWDSAGVPSMLVPAWHPSKRRHRVPGPGVPWTSEITSLPAQHAGRTPQPWLQRLPH